MNLREWLLQISGEEEQRIKQEESLLMKREIVSNGYHIIPEEKSIIKSGKKRKSK